MLHVSEAFKHSGMPVSNAFHCAMLACMLMHMLYV